MARVKSTSDPGRVKRVASFLSDSLNDYLAARLLFRSHLPQQAAVLASTAIEKAFKALLAFHGNESRGHLKKAHWRAVKNFDLALFSRMDLEFLELNKKAYLLRYSDQLPSGFNLVIASREYLAELDKTIISVHNAITIGSKEGNRSPFHHLVSIGDERLVTENFVLSGMDQQHFITSAPQYVYEVRNDAALGLLTAFYSTTSHPKRAGFLRGGLVPSDPNHMSYDVSHLPLPQADA